MIADQVKNELERQWGLRQDSLTAWRNIASDPSSLTHHDDSYNGGWSAGHMWEYSDGSILIEDGRGLVALKEKAAPYVQEDVNSPVNPPDWCEIHGFSGCPEDE